MDPPPEGSQPRAFEQNRRVDLCETEPPRPCLPEHGLEKHGAVGTGPARIMIREVLADVSLPHGPEQRVHHRMKEHVPVGVACRTQVEGDLDAADPQRTPRHEAMAVETVADPEHAITFPESGRLSNARMLVGSDHRMRKRSHQPSPAASTRPWEAVVDSLQEGLIAIDGEGRITALNAAAEHWLGVSQLNARGRTYREVLAPARWLIRLVAELTSRDRGGIRAAGQIEGPGGRPLSVRASASATFDGEGRRLGTAVLLQDQSFQMDLEEDLHRAQSLSHLGSVVAGLAHEIKNPLSGIRGAVQLLRKELRNDSDAEPYTGLILREVDRLTALVEQLLPLGSRGEIRTEAFNVHEAIEHVLSLLAPDAAERHISLVRLFDPSLPPVEGQRDALIQVFLNLIQNALQAFDPQSGERVREVRIRSRLETNYHRKVPHAPAAPPVRYLRIDVEDNGPGIPGKHQSDLFSPFFTTRPNGTGLGLAVSHRIASDHGGTIRFESRPGKTVFRVILPVARTRER